MCGIVGYVGRRPCGEVLLQGLERLEYRGYDSAGLSLLTDGRIDSVRAVGNLAKLREVVESSNNGFDVQAALRATTGIGHTRWATHGEVSERNAHPHSDCTGTVHVVVNGIVENYTDLRHNLEFEGHTFSSDTDAEVVAHLVEKHLAANDDSADLVESVRLAFNDMAGHYAFCVLSSSDPGVLIGARRECPLVVGIGEGEHFIASAIPAFLRDTRQVLIVQDGDVVKVTAGGTEFSSATGERLEREAEEVTWDGDAAEKAGYSTFMLKEINEQPDAVADTLAGRITHEDLVDLSEIGFSDDELRTFKSLTVIGCGTAYHAGLIGRYAIEEWVGMPVGIDIASEYRYRRSLIGPDDLMIGISQSGETADTLAAMRLARERGARVMALTNVMGSQATRDADGVLYTRAGLEIGVAATKTLVAQITAMFLLGLKLAQVHETLAEGRIQALVADLKALPRKVEELLQSIDERVRAIARSHYEKNFFLYLGRHIGLPICLEGALKLKEISYIPTEAYAAGEMKHGPIALLDGSTPVVAVATESPVLDKMLSNIAQVKARGAEVIAIATEGSAVVAAAADQTIFVPQTDWILQSILAVIPLQLLAYHIARLRELNVDQPRNLAKTVTVE